MDGVSTYRDCAVIGEYHQALRNPSTMTFCKKLELVFRNLWHANKAELLIGLALVITGCVIVGLGGVGGFGLVISAPVGGYLIAAGSPLLISAMSNARHMTAHQTSKNKVITTDFISGPGFTEY